MATPYFATEYTLAAMNLDPTLRRHISVSYLRIRESDVDRKNSLKKLKDDAAAFIKNSNRR